MIYIEAIYLTRPLLLLQRLHHHHPPHHLPAPTRFQRYLLQHSERHNLGLSRTLPRHHVRLPARHAPPSRKSLQTKHK